jgi:hypothetical protein
MLGLIIIRVALAQLLFDDRTEFIIERRRCGQSVDQQTETCLECGGREFSQYELPMRETQSISICFVLRRCSGHSSGYPLR